MRDPQTLIRLTEQLDAVKARRKSGARTTDPVRLAENRHAKACQPRAKMLVEDYDFDAITAWQIALDDKKFYEFQRFATLKGAELASPSRAQSSVAKISAMRQAAPPPTPERKPNESYASFRRRVGAHVAQLAQSAGAPSGTSRPSARPADAGRPDVGLAEKSEAGYVALKAAELVSHAAMVREISHRATTGGATTLSESKNVRDRALDRMKALGQSTHRDAKDFSENYKRSLKALEGIK